MVGLGAVAFKFKTWRAKLTFALYSGGISDAQKREIVDGIILPHGEGTS